MIYISKLELNRSRWSNLESNTLFGNQKHVLNLMWIRSRSTKQTVFRSWFNRTPFGAKWIRVQFKAMKYII